MKKGDLVKIREDVDVPEFNWSDNFRKPEKGKVGFVRDVVDDIVIIDFASMKGFKALVSEVVCLEVVK